MSKTPRHRKPGSSRPPTAPPTVWLQDRVDGRARRKCLAGFEGEIRCDDPDTFAAAVDEVDRLRAAGKHLAGFISYEAGYLTEKSLSHLLPRVRDVPLIWMGIFTRVEEVEISSSETAPPVKAGVIEGLAAELEPTDYQGAITRTLDYIKAGDIYQANFTYRSAFSWSGNPLNLFDALTRTQPVPYAAYIDTGEEVILSLSPELFFDISGGIIRARPMKGTSKRGRTNDEDAALSEALTSDPKERAENLMILDLMRNDLSRVAVPGSVRVPERFTVERYRTVLQMTSSVEARLKTQTSFTALLGALFPCGSVTGAPKVRAMEIICELEQSPRGVYTGAIGHLGPTVDGEGEAAFNVAIRTLTLKPDGATDKAWRGTVGVGGGIVFDSTPAREYQECQVKIKFLDRPDKEPIQLIETMKVDAGEIALLEEHLARLAASAHYFDFPCDRDDVRRVLLRHASDLGPGIWRLRLLLGADGALEFSHAALGGPRPPLGFSIAPVRVDSNDVFLFHKTTRRAVFEETLAAEAARVGADEVVFMNERGELTEGARSTLFLRKGRDLLTPPLASGCLPGTLRASMLQDPGTRVIEQVLSLDDLHGANEIFFGNSVRGLERALLIKEGRVSEDLKIAGE